MARRALCIGINAYPGTGFDLRGCVNDAHDWAERLSRHDFAMQPLLLDGDATLEAMRGAIDALLRPAAAGDSMVIVFAGHGTCHTPDSTGDELEGYDQGFAPSDVHVAGPMVDDEIHWRLNQRPLGSTLLLIADSCHSGSVSRAWWNPPNTGHRGPLPRALPTGAWPKAAHVPDASTPVRKLSELVQLDDDILMAACKDGSGDFAADVYIADRPCGLFTHHALTALDNLERRGDRLDYRSWFAEIECLMPRDGPQQHPQCVMQPGAALRPVFQ